MRTRRFQAWMRRLAAVTLGGALILEGCNPTLRSTTEDGIITASQSLLAAFLQAAINVAGEDAP